MLNNSHVVKHIIDFIKNVLLGSTIQLLVNHLLSIELKRSMEVLGGSSDVGLVIWSGREVTGPVAIGVVRVWEHVVIFGWPCDIVLLEGVSVGTWSRILEVI